MLLESFGKMHVLQLFGVLLKYSIAVLVNNMDCRLGTRAGRKMQVELDVGFLLWTIESA